jgi:hypothetical protein
LDESVSWSYNRRRPRLLLLRWLSVQQPPSQWTHTRIRKASCCCSIRRKGGEGGKCMQWQHGTAAIRGEAVSRWRRDEVMTCLGQQYQQHFWLAWGWKGANESTPPPPSPSLIVVVGWRANPASLPPLLLLLRPNSILKYAHTRPALPYSDAAGCDRGRGGGERARAHHRPDAAAGGRGGGQGGGGGGHQAVRLHQDFFVVLFGTLFMRGLGCVCLSVCLSVGLSVCRPACPPGRCCSPPIPLLIHAYSPITSHTYYLHIPPPQKKQGLRGGGVLPRHLPRRPTRGETECVSGGQSYYIYIYIHADTHTCTPHSPCCLIRPIIPHSPPLSTSTLLSSSSTHR